ncbi:hypothetical protein ACEPAH_1404 [Sanghuangporus vaninii]
MYPYAFPHYPAPEPFPARKPPESHAVNTRHSVSPIALRSKARAGSDDAGSRLDTVSSGLSLRDSNYNKTYKTNATMGASTRPRSQSHSQSHSQSRSRSPHPQVEMNPYSYSSRQSASSHRRTTSSHVPSTGSFSFPAGNGGTFHYVPHAGSRSQAAYAPGRLYGSEPTPGWPLPSRRVPYEPAPLPGPWSQSSSSRYPIPPPSSTLAQGFIPPRPPSPASHYPFANHESSGRSGGVYAERASGSRHTRSRDQRSTDDYDITPPPPYSAVTSSQADSTVSDPLIHPALGWWPDQRRPALYWDLSSSSRPRYTKREFDTQELTSSPFTPPLSRMRLVLDPHAQWKFDLSAPRGERYITLASLLKDIASLMHAPNMVPHAYWVRASTSKKEAIVRAMLRRTGGTLPIPPPHRRPKSRGQIMEEAVVEGAPNGFTKLLVVDLLCDDVMFAGMEFHKEPDEWVLRTMRRYS